MSGDKSNPPDWKPIGLQPGSLTGVFWQADRLHRCDPYLVWWDISSYAPDDRETITVLLQLRRGVDGNFGPIPHGLALAPTHPYAMRRPPTSEGGSPLKGLPEYGSYEISRQSVSDLVAQVASNLGPLLRFEVALPHRTLVPSTLLQRFANPIIINPALLDSTRFQLWRWPSLPGPRTYRFDDSMDDGEIPARKRSKPLIGVLDDGCSFSAAHLTDKTGAAVLSVWDQGVDQIEELRRKTRGYKSSSRFRLAVINRARYEYLFGAEWRPSRLDDDAEVDRYQSTGYLHPTRSWSHGSAVLGLLSQPYEQSAERSDCKPPCRNRDAPDLVFVQFPGKTVNDTSGGSLAAHAIDGILHVLQRAGPDRHVIVNLSYGTHGGPHDGTSMFDGALLGLLNDFPKLHIVLPAGNTHLSRTHAHGRIEPGQTLSLRWMIAADDPTDTFCEIWTDIADGMAITLTPPSSPSVECCSGEAWYWRSEPGVQETVHAAIVFPKAVAQGNQGTMALLAVSPTRLIEREPNVLSPSENRSPKVSQFAEAVGANRKPVRAPSGSWRIDIRNESKEVAFAHAWIQRDDAAPGRGPGLRGFLGRQSYFLDADPEVLFRHNEPIIKAGPEPQSTLNGLATFEHDRVHVVGAQRAADGGVAMYSAAGPRRGDGRRFEGPDVVVVADRSIPLPGVLTHGNLSPSRIRLSGTSLAAARYSRLLYEILAEGKPATSARPVPRRSAGEESLPIGAQERPVETPGSPKRADRVFRGELKRY